MPSKIIKFLIGLVLIGAAVSYLVVLNPTNVKLSYSPSGSWEAPLAVVIIGIFMLGAFAVGLLSFLLATRNAYTNWKREKAITRLEQHRDSITSARTKLALMQYSEATTAFSKITSQDPKNVSAWLALSETYKQQGENTDALHILDRGRQANSDNLELLFRAAELNEEMGNYTGAFDNASLVLVTSPGNNRALGLQKDYAKKLKRFDEARSALTQLIKRAHGAKQKELQLELAGLELKQISTKLKAKTADYKKALSELLRKHREYAPAVSELALIEREEGNLDAAGKLWTKSYQKTQDPTYLECLAAMWLKAEDPAKCVSVIKNAVYSNPGAELDLSGRVFLVTLYLHLEMIQDAKNELGSLETLQDIPEDTRLHVDVMRAKIFEREGDPKKAFQTLLARMESSNLVPTFSSVEPSMTNGAARPRWRRRVFATPPPPSLSTP